MLDQILRNFIVFVDGENKLGTCEELTLPKLTLKTEEYRGGGMDVPIEIDLGLEKLEMDFSLTSFDKQVIGLYGLKAGSHKSFTFRGSLAGEAGSDTGVIVNTKAKIKEIDSGAWKPGDKAELKISLALHYYKLTHSGSTLIEIDPDNLVRIIDGVDQNSSMRQHLGL